MDYPLLMSGGEAVRNLLCILDRVARREAASRELRSQRLAFEKFLNDIGSPVVLTNVVDRGDVGMVEGACSLSLLLEAAQPVVIRREGRRKDFDRDVAFQPLVPSPVDLAHPARAERRDDLVRAKPRAGFQGHVGRNYRPLMAPPTPVVEGPDAEEYRSDSSSTWTNDDIENSQSELEG